MTINQQVITILMAVAATMVTRFLPFILFSKGDRTPPFVRYLGRVLPPAVFGLLVVYCLKNLSVLVYPYALPEIIAIAAVVLLHLWKRQMLLSIFSGTLCYMVLLQLVFKG